MTELWELRWRAANQEGHMSTRLPGFNQCPGEDLSMASQLPSSVIEYLVTDRNVFEKKVAATPPKRQQDSVQETRKRGEFEKITAHTKEP
ncbi:hypothetical protein Trydic_g3084 [Trypoxylus dichotomus]